MGTGTLVTPQGLTGSITTATDSYGVWTGSGADSGKIFTVTTSPSATNNNCYSIYMFDNNTTYGLGTMYQSSSVQSAPITHILDFNYGAGKYPVITNYDMWNGDSSLFATAWIISGSHDGNNWTQLDSRSNQSANLQGVNYSFSNNTAYRYYKYVITAGSQAGYITTIELKMYASVFGTLVTPQGLTGSITTATDSYGVWTGSGADSGKIFTVTTSPSATNNNCYSIYMFDNNTTYGFGTMYQSSSVQSAPITHILDFNYGAGKYPVITNYAMWNGDSSLFATAWIISGSHDGNNWTQLDSRSNQSANLQGVNYSFSNNTAYRYYKYVITAGSQAGYITTIELKMYESVFGTINPSLFTFHG